MYDFQYVKPANLYDAVAAMGSEDAQALSGGQTLTPTMKQRLAQPGTLVDLTGVPELKGIEVGPDSVTIKAATRHVEVERSAELRAAIPALVELASRIGDPQVRNRGTIGGSVANNDPSACYPAAVMALDGVVVTNNREISASDFFQGVYATALEENEIVTAVRFRRPDSASYQKFVQPASRFALTGVFLAKFGPEARVAVTGASENGVFRHAGLEQALSASFTAAAADPVAVSADGMIQDLHGTPAYRAHLIKVMTKRAVQACGG
ncbi:MAG: xanthine dehydrogenase family protein subunit M [Rhodobacteraceae bacterium]|nr:xanthine dehydrogenase family protein subunit M [Paracoccaceae bacterium]